jgi:hypothetical protein
VKTYPYLCSTIKTITAMAQKILTIGQLREAIKHLDDNDQVVLEETDLDTGDAQDLYPFYIDVIDGIKLNDGTEVREIRFCQMDNIEKHRILSPDGFDIRMDKQHFREDEIQSEIEAFVARFEAQGYYSTVQNGQRIQIALKDLPDHVKVVAVD